MGWTERLIYMALFIGLYCIGRMHGENRELINRALRAKEFAKALNENRIDDIEYRLQDDVKVCAYNSFTSLSFGPNLWQRQLPQEKIAISFKKRETHPVAQQEESQSLVQPQKTSSSLFVVEALTPPVEAPVVEEK